VAFIGIDIGTQSLKVVVVDEALRTLGRASQAYEVDYPRPGWAQQDPALWDEALTVALARALSSADRGPNDVRAIGVSGQLDGCIAVDDNCEPMGPCLIWSDRRGAKSLPELDPAWFRTLTGQTLDATHMAAKCRWLKTNAVGLEGARFHQPVSYLVERLCGRYVYDRGLASTTMLFGLQSGEYEPELLRAFGLDVAELPEIAEAHSCAGTVSKLAASRFGLAAGTTVAVGTGDDFATPLGGGLVRPGTIACGLGTAEVVGTLAEKAVIDESGLVETHRYVNDLYYLENPGWLSGGAVSWARRILGIDSDAEFDAAAAAAPPGCAGVTFLPALSGAMAPEWNASVHGAFSGLTATHDRSHLARAVLEGCAFAMYDVILRLTELGLASERLLLLGGGAASSLWAQLRADLCELPTEARVSSDTCALGAVMLAMVAAGSASSVETLEVEGEHQLYEPVTSPALRAAHQRYLALYHALATS
jgi:xylulokinase